jgi:hypothetical protein
MDKNMKDITKILNKKLNDISWGGFKGFNELADTKDIKMLFDLIYESIEENRKNGS